MAMENSSAVSNDASKEISSATQEDLTFFGAGTAQQGSDDTTQKSNPEESLPDEKPKDGLDPEGDFVDAEAVADDADAAGVNSLDLGMPSEDAEGEDLGEDENGSVESFDSALERIAVVSSPEGPSSPFFQPAETMPLVEGEERQAVEDVADVGAEDTLVEGEERKSVEDVGDGGAKGTDDANVAADGAEASKQENSSLVESKPLIEGEERKAVEVVADVGAKGTDDSNVAADGVEAREQENSSLVESNGDLNKSEAIEGHPAEVVQSEDVGDGANTTNKSATAPDIEDGSSERSLPDDVLKDSAANLDSDDGAAETQVKRTNNYEPEREPEPEPEPEVIEWDDLNESDAEDLVNSNVEPYPVEIRDSGEVGESVDAAGLKQETGTPDADQEPKTSAMVGQEKGVAESEPEVDSSTGNAVVEEPRVQHVDDNGEVAREPEALEAQETGCENEGPVKLETAEEREIEYADSPVGSKEVDEDAAYGRSEVVEAVERLIASGDSVDKAVLSGDEKYGGEGDTGSNASVDEEQPLADGVVEREDIEALPREIELDEGKAEASETVLADAVEQVSAKAVSPHVSEEGTMENVSVGATGVFEGLGDGKEPSTAQIPDMEDGEILERELPSEKDGPFKGDESELESPIIEKTVDVLGNGESLTENTSPVAAFVDSKEEESKEESPIIEKASDASAEGEESVTEDPPSVAVVVGSKASTAPGNDAASSLGGAGPSLPVRPAGLGRSVPSLDHAPRAVQRSSGVPASIRQSPATNEENQSSTDVSEGSEDAREKLQMIRVKFLRLAHRLGQSAHNVVVAQVLYRLGLAEQLRGGRGTGRTGAFSFERASVLAEEQEAAGAADLEFGCTIMVLGKSGVGKSATINSLFDEVKSGTNAYVPATNKVQEIIGTVHGIKLRVIDTPGLLTSFADQRRNERIMASVKRFIKKSPPDIVLYFDRLDMQSRDYGDLPLLRTITDTFGSAVWFNAIVVLTHASSAPPDGANGVPVSYEMFVAQRSHVVQQTIRQAAGDMRLMNPVSLVENHAACRRNRAGERVLPNGQVWKPQLLLLCFASKILAEANSLLKLQDNSPAKPFGVRSRVPPLPFLLSSLLQSRAQLKLPDEQMGSDDESEDESEDEAGSEGEEEYDDLPPFRRLTRDELKLLDKEQRRIYAEELEYREKLFMRKQLKDERARKKEMKRRFAALPKEAAQYAEESLEEENASASVPVPMPDMALPPSFDSDNPTHRYRYLDTANQWLVRPVLETHGWDHDSGYDGLNVEKMFVISKKVPVSVSGQVTKDKKEANLQMECAASFKNGEGKVTQAGLDIQTIGKDLAYTLRSETRFDNFKRNKTTCGLAVTLLGDTVAAGMKIEDRLLIGKRVKLVFNGGALTGRGDVAYGGSLEATVRDKDYPIGTFLSTFGLSVMDWHGDLAIGGNLQVQCKVGKTMTIVRGNLNNRRAGQVSIRVSSSEQLQMALIGLIPLLRTFINNRILSSN